MATFLELCEKLADQSGGTGRAPASVTAQVGRQKKIVGWVRDAWVTIQNLHAYWRFMRAEFEGTLTPGATTYAASSFALSRFAEWYGRPSIYDPDIGREDEAHLQHVAYETWQRRWDFRTHDANRPTEYALGPDMTLRVGAKPDLAYTIRGEFVKAPQVLAENADVPDLPARFHDIIMWRAAMLLASHDEAINAMQLAEREYRELLVALERDQLPQVSARAGRPLA